MAGGGAAQRATLMDGCIDAVVSTHPLAGEVETRPCRRYRQKRGAVSNGGSA